MFKRKKNKIFEKINLDSNHEKCTNKKIKIPSKKITIILKKCIRVNFIKVIFQVKAF